ncbi:hypothetical protein FA13DRAFT_1724096 [Coprinellus micaceus]|uniref:Uncharacterized protein n=1 Tax=Coprinellus micaceus TaxID=71717 RepID=A0A4Y7U0D0_COPMI|nr:hypothetical protein FA13DRAFT_1724096 [Coprinellus micaceus]
MSVIASLRWARNLAWRPEERTTHCRRGWYDKLDMISSVHLTILGWKQKVLTCHCRSRDEEGLHKHGTGAGIRGRMLERTTIRVRLCWYERRKPPVPRIPEGSGWDIPFLRITWANLAIPSV